MFPTTSNPKVDALAFEDGPAGRYARGVRHTEQRVRFKTAAGTITTTLPRPDDVAAESVYDLRIEFRLSDADLVPIRLRH